ncbi:MAG: Bax inhibitor-1/YccA family protein [Gemmatimonadota bacterium]
MLDRPSLQNTAAMPVAGTLAADARVSTFLRRVYGWMFVGLAITAVVALLVASSPALIQAIFGNQLLFWGLVIAELALVFFISARVGSLAPAAAAGLFVLYSALNGATLALILLIYTGASIASAFFVASGMFGALALYGTVTRKSLAGWSSFLFMGLIGVVLASVVGIFWQNSALQFVLGVAGVIVFTGLTAYDAQRLKVMALELPDGRVATYAVSGALSLYLDFINLFLSLLRLFGSRR